MIDDSTYLQQALDWAQKKRGFCAPNPAVGAVLVKEHEILSYGTHVGPGKPHAEIMALNQAKGHTQGSILYITLEPCCHWGRTPPCTQAIIDAGVKKVIYSHRDPNPAVFGKSAALLKSHSISCEQISLPAIEAFYQSYDHWWKTSKPFVTFKIALSLDGKIALAGGERVTLTGQAAAEVTHQKRFHSDAILTTARTILADDPYFTARYQQAIVAKPLYILDRTQQLTDLSNLKLFHPSREIHLFFAKGLSKLSNSEADCLHLKREEMQVDAKGFVLNSVLKKIGEQGVHDLWVEAGGQLLNALLDQQLINRLYIYMAPKVLGATAVAAFKKKWDFLASASQLNWKVAEEDCILTVEFCDKGI